MTRTNTTQDIPTCHACTRPATRHWERPATPDEGTAYLQAMDEWRIHQGLGPLPENAAIRHADHHVLVHGCDDHGPEPTP